MTDRRSFLGAASVALTGALPVLSRAADATTTPGSLPAGARVPKFEFVYECDATLLPAVEMGKTVEGQRRIIPITGGGGTPPAPSANGEALFMFTHPEFEAPAGKYDWMNRGMFVGTLGARKDARNAVLIRVFQLV